MADIAAIVDMVMIGTALRFEYQGASSPASAAAKHASAVSCDRPKICLSKLSRHRFPHAVFSRMTSPCLLSDAASTATGHSPVNESAMSVTRAAGPGKNGAGNNGGSGTGVITRTRAKTAKPSMYKVLLLNDDYTPMEFVIHVLERLFHKNHDEATQIMLHVHQKGVGVCGVYPYEIAETKVTQVIDLARKHQHPLQCTLEKD